LGSAVNISRWPAAGATSTPAYCHEEMSYCPFFESHPLNRPSRSSVSRKSGETMAAAFV
jgi:hypothetical protein